LFMHLCGDPKDAIGYVLAPLFFVLEVIGVIAKPISLSLRLFGNMLGKDILLGAFTMMGIMLVAVVSKDLSHYVGAPLTIPFYFLGILLSAIQALVFSILSAIYILLMLPHEHHDHDDHGHGHDAPGHAPLEGAHAH
jgi:F-type H+-transporting ATPase subunit a